MDDVDDRVLLDRVRHSRRLSNGVLSVVSAGTRDVRLFTAEGAYIKTIGRGGDGPGEFREPWLVFEAPGDSLLVIDLSGRLSIFTQDGTYARSFRVSLPSTDLQALEPIGMFGDGTLLYRAHHLEDPNWSGTVRTAIRLLRYDLMGRLIGPLGDYLDQTVSVTPQYRGPVLFGAWGKSTTSDSSFWYGPGDRFDLREIAFDGHLIRIVRLDSPGRQVTESDVSAVFAEGRERYRGTGREQAYERLISEMTVATTKPAHFDILVDGPGHLWVQEYEYTDVRQPLRWHVFTPSGEYLGAVITPEGFMIHQVGDDFVLGLLKDDLDVEYVAQYELLKPGS